MEYAFGSLITLAMLWFIRKMLAPTAKLPRLVVRNSQSNSYEQVKEAMPIIRLFKKKEPTQATNFLEQQKVKILMMDNKAYWISSSRLYTAEVVNGKIDKNSAKTVDTISMDDVQLDKTIFIVSKLTEGLEDDRGNSWNT